MFMRQGKLIFSPSFFLPRPPFYNHVLQRTGMFPPGLFVPVFFEAFMSTHLGCFQILTYPPKSIKQGYKITKQNPKVLKYQYNSTALSERTNFIDSLLLSKCPTPR